MSTPLQHRVGATARRSRQLAILGCRVVATATYWYAVVASAATWAPTPATLVPLIHPEWAGVWQAVPGSVDDAHTPFEAGARAAHGAHVPRETPPLKPEYLASYKERIKQMMDGQPIVDPSQAECQPYGLPRMMLTSHAFRISVMPDKIVLYMPWTIQPRLIYLDGRLHPSDDDIDLTYRGQSIGHWEGDTLVIDTKGFTKKTWVDGTGVPHGERMHVVERGRMLQAGMLEWRISVDDPDYFVKPWSTTLRYARVESGDIGDEYSCSTERSHGNF